MTKVLINQSPGSLLVRKDVLDKLLASRPDLFSCDPDFLSILGVQCGTNCANNDCVETTLRQCNAVMRGDEVYLLRTSAPEFRCDPLVVSMVERRGSCALDERPHVRLKVVEVPAGVDWYILENEDGAEEVHEVHRVWR